MKIGRLRVIFKLPRVLNHFQEAPRNWPTDHLAYVEWYKVGQAGANHNMLKVGKHVEDANGVTPGAIVSLRAIRQSCHLIPLTGPTIPWDSNWKSDNVLDLSTVFLLNNWSSKFAYQTLW